MSSPFNLDFGSAIRMNSIQSISFSKEIVAFSGDIFSLSLPFLFQEFLLLLLDPMHLRYDKEPYCLIARFQWSGYSHPAARRVNTEMHVLYVFLNSINHQIIHTHLYRLSSHLGSSQVLTPLRLFARH